LEKSTKVTPYMTWVLEKIAHLYQHVCSDVAHYIEKAMLSLRLEHMDVGLLRIL